MNCPEKNKQMIFICYANEDYDIALKLYKDIKHAGGNPWMSKENIQPGQHWEFEINKAIDNSSFFLALLSGNSISKKGFLQKELKKGLKQLEKVPQDGIFIIPVRLEECYPSDEELQKIQWVDLFPSYDEGLKKILCTLNISSDNNEEEVPSLLKLSQWLEDAGFKRNPFVKKDADNDPYLKEYFVEPLGFEEVLGNNSVVLYAPKGGGKTACRIMAEHTCKTGYGLNDKVLCVSYNNIQEVFEQIKHNQDSVTVAVYVKNILKNAVPKLFEKLMVCPEQKQKELEQLRLIMDDDINDFSPVQVMKSFADMIKTAGFDSLFILVNNTDNLCLTFNGTYSYKEAFEHFIVENLKLTDKYDIFFKFFLPSDIYILLNHSEFFFKIKKLKAVYIEWPEEKLREILRLRLKAATQKARGSPITSLDELSRTGFLRIDDVLLKYSKTPRELIKLGENILMTRLILTPDKDYITEQVLESVLRQIDTE
ncbi:MAG: toll/interleukin-1 receptor domain-containing protein [Desulfobacterales bacterium]|nr:toll/interleukin-1 receptor domain-containing protein [Desulfobacterales bacterium]